MYALNFAVDTWTYTHYQVYHQGGGWCTTLEDCAARSTGSLGSSKGSPKTITGTNYLVVDEHIAPLWHNWNHLYMTYCDGASFSGNRDGTVTDPKSGKALQFRGHRNLQAAMRWALDHGFADATDVMVSGSSAGGLATFLHTAEWCEVFENGKLHSDQDGGDGSLRASAESSRYVYLTSLSNIYMSVADSELVM
jgi:hypothetical protein